MDRTLTLAIIKRVLLCILVGMAISALISEVSYLINHDPNDRDKAHRVELVVPAGTAERIANGETSIGVPNRMSFVAGDLLIVKNEDSVAHQLGPIWVPPQSSGVLEIGAARDYSYACSFSDTQTFGLEVRPELSAFSRFNAVAAMGLPTSAMFALYSFLIFPLKLTPPQLPQNPAGGA